LKAGGGMAVGLPNSDRIFSKATGTLSLPHVPTRVHIFADSTLNRSLVATADFCNNGCTATFTATSATIIHDATGEVISQSFKHPRERLWPFHMSTPAANTSIGNVVRHELNADFVAYSSASFFSPPDTSLIQALNNGWLGNFPRLTAAMVAANKPNSISTAKGHLQQTRQKNHRHTMSTPESPPAAEASDADEYSDSVLTKLVTRQEFLNSSDMPDRFPYISHRGYAYMLISVFKGYIKQMT